MKQTWSAPERNKGPILDVLLRVLPARATVLEIASGSGQHAVHFATQCPGWTWQPSDIEPANLTSIAAWVAECVTECVAERALHNLLSPITLDVCTDDWGVGTVDAVFCANMIHIAPWACAEALIAGAGCHVAHGGHLLLYGPFRIDGHHTSESNATFDQSLKSRDPSWGVRDLEAVTALATAAGFTFVERIQMPANNQTLVYRRS